MEKDSELRSVSGLVDSARAAEWLGVSQSQIRTWMRRKAEGSTTLPALFPGPISVDDAGGSGAELNRGRVWHRSDIEDFAIALAEYEPKGGRTPARLKDKP